MSVGNSTVRLLGPPRVRFGDGWIDLAGDKRHLLLAHLAYQGAWVRRDRLAYLFWPDVPSSRARSRLRQLVRRVRRLPWAHALDIEPSRLRWPVTTDVARLRAALDGGDASTLVETYGGPLLYGVSSDAAPEFAAWLDVERAALHERWRGAVLAAAENAVRQDRSSTSAPWLEAILREDPLDEEALRTLMSVLAETGQRQRARSAYRAFASTLADTVGVEPAPETRRLASSLDDASPGAVDPAPSDRAAAGGYAPATRFVGRDAELLQVRSLLDAPECRLLTLMGMGGIGKSRIAFETAAQWDAPAHVVRLDALSEPAEVPHAIADALGGDGLADGDAIERLAGKLGRAPRLLVLDNAEHLVGVAGLLARLLRLAPSLSVLVTSRERLGIAEEWVLPVEGLRVPSPSEPPNDARGYDAVQLFQARAAQIRAGDPLTADELPAAIRICRLLHGLPLGIELAAARVRSVPISAVADEIEVDADVLRRRHDPDGHGSLRAVFESSWRQLADEERRALAALSVFVGGFTRAAAHAVTHASTSVLASLADKSLLQLLPGGRYDRHPLLYRYTREKLDERGDAPEFHRHHARFFLARAEAAGTRLRRPRGSRDLDALEADHENLRAALRWGLANEPGLALRLAGSLGSFWEIRGHLAEGCGWLDAALARGDEAGLSAPARALEASGRLLYLRGDRDAAAARSRAALARWERAGDDAGRARALSQLAALALDRGALDDAEARYLEALAASETAGDRGAVGRLLNNLGEVARMRGELAAAEAHYAEALAIHEDQADARAIAIVQGNLGYVTRRLGRPREAASLLRESMTLKHRLGDDIGTAYNLAGLAGVLADVGACDDATRLLGAARKLLADRGVTLDAADRADAREVAAR
ncbi:MAG: tetratricopeptide repeat protein, partial [Deinococcus-Thermus bacterium]|nr:tetratricopeptide repeat protein [Deinococcota bacterium]